MSCKVTVRCITYNHEKHIADALQGFVNQETDFPIEVLVHDDASTDSTASIIREFEEKYRDIIKPIYQTENQYSKGIKIRTFLDPLTTGEYIAVCEGDDYFCSELHLKRCVDYLDAHPECSLVFTACKWVDQFGKSKDYLPDTIERDFSIEEILKKGGGLIPTASMVYRSEYMKNLPNYLISMPFGDWPTAIHLASKGTVHFFPELDTVYNYMHEGSYSLTHKKKSGKQLETYHNKVIQGLEYMKVELDSSLIPIVDQLIEIEIVEKLSVQGKLIEILKNHRKQFWKLSMKGKLRIFYRMFIPQR